MTVGLGFTNFFFVYNITVTNLLVDTLLPIVGMCALLYVRMYCDGETKDRTALCLSAAYLTQIIQIKNSGIYFVLIAVIWILWKGYKRKDLTEKVFAYSSGVHVSDTQTGLRGIPRAFLKGLLDVKGDRFEFETRMLLEAAGTIPIVEVPIETIYDSEENHQTHFKPIRDSLRIYRIFAGRFLKFIFSSLSSSILDLILFSLFCMVFKKKYPGLYAGIATVAARIFSAIYNYTINYKVVFRSREKVAVSGLRYLILAVLQMMCSAVLVTVLVKALPAFPELLPKIAVDTVLFFVSYKIQQKLVFHV